MSSTAQFRINAVAGAGTTCAAIALGAALACGGLPVLGYALLGLSVVVVISFAVRSAFDDLTRVPYWAACAGAFLVSANGMRRGSLTYSDAVIVAALVPAALVGLRARQRVPWWLPVGVLLLAGSLAISEMFPVLDRSGPLFQVRNLGTGAQDLSSGISLAARLILAVAVIPLALSVTVTSLRRARDLTTIWLLGIGFSSLVGVLAAFTRFDFQEALTGNLYAFEAYRDAAGRFTGLSVHPTLFGVAAAMALPVALARIISRRTACVYSPLVGLYVGAALISGSRAAFIGTILAFVLVFAWQARGRKQLAAIVIIGGLVVSTQGPAFASSLSAVQRFTGGTGLAGQSAQESDSSRFGAIAESVELFMERPVTGWGYEAIRGAHNTWLQLASSGGLLALAGWGTIVFGALALGWKMRRTLPERASRDALGLCASLVVFLAAGLSMNAVLDRFLYVPVGLILALWFGTRDRGGAHTGQRRSLHGNRRVPAHRTVGPSR
ncbi:MAG: O-antigen ligase family protein [Solirubrobacteraceae bacterium]|nr:O-antigen ligase family protein [Solirubrobacteraceae bacterium]